MIYGQNKGHISCYEQVNQLPELKNMFVEYKEVAANALQDAIERLDKSYANTFRRIKSGDSKAGFPRFKSEHRYRSFTLKKTNWRINGNHLSIYKLGTFRIKMDRPIDGIIKTVTIICSNTDKWYVCFACGNIPSKVLEATNKVVGIDMGIKSFCVDSDGNKLENPLFMRQAEDVLRRKQRRLSRRIKGSNRWKWAKGQVTRMYEKIANQRNDYLHKISRDYIKRYDILYIENLKIDNMKRNKSTGKHIADSSWGRFFECLIYKAEEAGREVVKVNPMNTSQLCSGCQKMVDKTLNVRIHSCPYCGLIMDRDVNAAINILRVGQTRQSLTPAMVGVGCKSNTNRSIRIP